MQRAVHQEIEEENIISYFILAVVIRRGMSEIFIRVVVILLKQCLGG
jgi:hypothetical protein